MIRSIALLLNIIICLLYIAEAIYIDVLQNNNSEVLMCRHTTWNDSDTNW